jgi:16S rRNA (guanine527-N7)-methyltransferase
MFHVEPIELLESVLMKEAIPGLPDSIQRFALYQEMLLNWNRKMNLISNSDEHRIITRHFLQSIGILKSISLPMNASILDMGSGAGFPGIPIKLIRPDLFVVLAESIKKKADFLNACIIELGLQHTQVFCKHIDDQNRLNTPVDYILVRAVTDLTTLVRWSFPSLKAGGKLVAVKGQKAEEELKHLNKYFHRFQIVKCEVVQFNPFPDFFVLNDSVLVIIEK